MPSDYAKTINEFQNEVKSNNQKLVKLMNEIDNECKNCIEITCKKSIEIFKQTRVGGTEKEQGEGETFLFGDESHKAMPYKQEAAIKTHYKRLAKYIKLIDTMHKEAKLSIIKNTLKKNSEMFASKEVVKGKFAQVKGKLSHLLMIESDYDGEKLIFYPQFEEIKSIFNNALLQGMNFVSGQKQIIDDQKFEEYVSTIVLQDEKLTEDKFDMNNLIDGDLFINGAKLKIEKNMDELFAKILEISTHFQFLINIIEDNKKRDFESLKSEDPMVFKEWLTAFIEQENKVLTFEDLIHVGVITIDCRKLKERAGSFPKKNKALMKNFVPDLTFTFLSDLGVILKNIESRLTSDIKFQIGDYVKYMQFLRESKKKDMEYTDLVSKCKDLHDIMAEFRMPVPSKQKGKYAEVKHLLDTERTKLNHSIDVGERKEMFYKKELEKLYPLNKSRILELLNDLKNDEFFKNTPSSQANFNLIMELKKKKEII